ncbi:hypothetical protein XO10_03395 [Marinitoga sp. 1135]|uniref:Putative S-layer protein n=1 Tax=Marinitoga piezophila (strain DSM 14283 / JCM 11233 / KA3) TaxID=443254 RepID=H2J646_MARPK|nr:MULTISPECIES: S-layer homology domain-containing protein [Marinitoga]AEX85107.1 putative S-layer protein [Marinitoga piezophila KA3]APT75611.1 hypothetical protein LN42_03795 [Marinitoga sp. 1137]NUU95320.1 hypothetical protein [Marinitoga sp. 1135]NUU97254.1 hypothetical protein [Marinitoga sp. 1138]
MKKLLIILMALALAVASFAATTYKDVPVNHWAYDSIERLSSLGIIEGFPDGTYQGLSQVNRYQLTVALDRALKYVEQQLFATLAEKVVELDKKVNELSKQQGLSKDEINAMIKAQLLNMDTKEFNSKITQLENSVNELKSAYDVLSFLSSKTDAVEKEVSTYDARIKSLESQVAELKALYSSVESVKKDLSANKSAMETLGVLANKVAALEEKYNNEIMNLNDKFATKDDVEATVKEYLSDYAKISDLETRFVKSEDFKALEMELSSLKSKVDENANSINAFNTKLDNYVTKDTLKDYAMLSDLKKYATLGDLKDYALKTDLTRYLEVSALDTKLSNYVTAKTFNEKIEELKADISDSTSNNDQLKKDAGFAKTLGIISVLISIGAVVIAFTL